jgi:hypothetical protein
MEASSSDALSTLANTRKDRYRVTPRRMRREFTPEARRISKAAGTPTTSMAGTSQLAPSVTWSGNKVWIVAIASTTRATP